MSPQKMNNYSGWKPSPGDTLDTIDIQDIQQYIKDRKPCIVNYTVNLPIEDLKGTVMVEKKHKGRFGLGIKQKMDFKEFYGLLKQKNGDHYLSTQYEIESEGLDHFLAPPLGSVSVPPVWDLLPLIPHQMNLWMGYSESGTATGLHHDFHDNLYMLLKGKKTFDLFAPADAHLMGLHSISQVFQNGLIEYKDNRRIREDGAYLDDVCQYKIDKIQLQMDEEPDNQELEEQLEQLLDEMLEYEQEEEPEPKRVKKEDLPLSFSKYDLDSKNLKKAARITVHLEAGQSLYLPCGWFHHVTSQGGLHVALNYWAVPPTTDPFPTIDDYWKDQFSEIKTALENQQHA
ncbi:cupin-like domain-containing protein [Gorgonomyces haynaldii]|nr:cupin-like domain-containing protein [Gorgonomyces haynaldii]